MPLERKGCGWVLARQDTVLFILCELFTLTITSISFMKTRLIRTTINTADTNVILKQPVIIVILLSKSVRFIFCIKNIKQFLLNHRMALWQKTVAPFSEHKGGVGSFLKIPRSNSGVTVRMVSHFIVRSLAMSEI